MILDMIKTAIVQVSCLPRRIDPQLPRSILGPPTMATTVVVPAILHRFHAYVSFDKSIALRVVTYERTG